MASSTDAGPPLLPIATASAVRTSTARARPNSNQPAIAAATSSTIASTIHGQRRGADGGASRSILSCSSSAAELFIAFHYDGGTTAV